MVARHQHLEGGNGVGCGSGLGVMGLEGWAFMSLEGSEGPRASTLLPHRAAAAQLRQLPQMRRFVVRGPGAGSPGTVAAAA